ncbi:S8 family serine peptidase [Natrialbaceae archaeon A-CW3]
MSGWQSNRFTGLVLVASCLLAVVLAGAVAADAASGSNHVDSAPIDDGLLEAEGERTVLVVFDSTLVTASPGDIDARQEQTARAQEPLLAYAETNQAVTVDRHFWIQNVAVVTVNLDRPVLEDIATLEGVEAVRENGHLEGESVTFAPASTVVVDRASSTTVSGTHVATEIDASYGLNQINAPDVWTEYGTRGEGVTVGVLDSGVDPSHPDIEITGWADWDVDGTPRDTEPQDYDVHREPSGHGTHVAGTIVAEDRSGIHLGVAPDVDLLVGAALTDCDASGCDAREAQVLAGLEWAVEQELDVLTISIGLDTKAGQFIEPIRNAEAAGTLVVASVGNEGIGTSSAPGNEYDTVSVGASDVYGEILDMSGGEVVFTDLEWNDPPEDWPDEYVLPTVSAPGWEIPSTVVGGQYSRASGTSFSAPHVAGGAALLQAATDEHLTPAQLEAALIETAGKPDGKNENQDVRYGHGIINVYAAVELVVEGDLEVDDDDGVDGEDGDGGEGGDGTGKDSSSSDDTDDTDGSSGDDADDTDGSSGDDTEGTDGSSGDGTNGDATTDADTASDDSGDQAGDDETERDDASDSSDDGAATLEDDESPGFGIGVAIGILALLGLLGAGQRRPSRGS